MRFIFIAILFAVAAGCNTLPPEEGGSYTYIGYNAQGDVIVAGTLVLDFGDHPDEDIESEIGGTWVLTPVGDADVPGPQTGTGDLVGYILAGGQVSIGLNPNWADNNVYLSGTFADDRYEKLQGEWSYSSFLGLVASGDFVATRR
jgi:hypothetical protein